MTSNYTDTFNLKTSKLIQLKAITDKRVAYRGCNLKKRIILLYYHSTMDNSTIDYTTGY